MLSLTDNISVSQRFETSVILTRTLAYRPKLQNTRGIVHDLEGEDSVQIYPKHEHYGSRTMNLRIWGLEFRNCRRDVSYNSNPTNTWVLTVPQDT